MASVTHLNRSSPEAGGIPSSAVLDFILVIEQPRHWLEGFMLLRHGNVAAEGWRMPRGAQSQYSLYSLSKSFTSTGIGLAVHEGPLMVDDSPAHFSGPRAGLPLSQRITQGKSSIWKSKEVVHNHPPKDRAIGLPARCASIPCSR